LKTAEEKRRDAAEIWATFAVTESSFSSHYIEDSRDVIQLSPDLPRKSPRALACGQSGIAIQATANYVTPRGGDRSRFDRCPEQFARGHSQPFGERKQQIDSDVPSTTLYVDKRSFPVISAISATYV